MYSLISVFYQVKALVTVEPESHVTRQKGDMFRNGMRNNNMVRGVAMVLRLIYA